MTDSVGPPRDVAGGYPVRDEGDAWVEGADGQRFWGKFGAAGLLVQHEQAGVLLQHRVGWSHFGGTWGVPGGARHRDEDAVTGALREACEEAGVPPELLRLEFSMLLDLDYWSYQTVVARAVDVFDPLMNDPESLELRWVPLDQVDQLPLHPGFETAWPSLRAELARRVVVVVDVANVMGSRPTGWWKDRAGAATTLAAQLSELAAAGITADDLELPMHQRWPEFHLVVEGKARGLSLPTPAGPTDTQVTVTAAEADGDQAIVDLVAALRSEAGAGASTIVVVTSDRALRDRVIELGATVRGTGWLWERIDAVTAG